MLVPVWFGYVWGGMLVMTVWMMLPVLFRKPSTGSRWMTRACIGVQVWRSRPLDDPLALLLLVVCLALALGMFTAGQQRPWLLGACIASYFAAYFGFLVRRVRSYDTWARRPEASP
ncbi:MAG: hypothetical protein O2782_17080, partial [bacterium]|nr:hypothetical protein [bacterium]